MSRDLHPADAQALDKLLAVDPRWRGLAPSGMLTGCDADVLLHAGPAFEDPSRITRPILNSACVAAVYEGHAEDFARAEDMIHAGELRLLPAQNHGVVTPLASVVSQSMPLQIVFDNNQPDSAVYAPINGGGGPAMRLGLCNHEVLAHLRWLNTEFADVLGAALPIPIPLLPIARDSLAAGDDCHGRTVVATRFLREQLDAIIHLPAKATEFLATGPSFFLNLWMAAAKCMLGAAIGTAASSLVVTAGANGAETGIQVAGCPGRWFTHRADAPNGQFDDAGLPRSRALGAIGDSAIVDALGFGAMAMNYAPEQKKTLGRFMPDDALGLPERLLSVEHPGFGHLHVKVGMLARSVVAGVRQPVVSLGILDNRGELGRLGGGIYTVPMSIFERAVAAVG